MFEKIFSPPGEVKSGEGLAGARNVPPEFLNSGGYTKYTNFKAVDTKSVAFFYFTKKGERNDGEVRRVKTETHG